MKLNNLSRLTALLLALTMILPTFAVAEDGTAIGDLTATKLAQMASAEEMIAAGKCSICAGEVTNLNILEWPVAEANCLHAYLGTLAAPAAYEMLLALYDAKSSLYDAYINAHQKHVRDNGAQWTICYDECAAYGGYKVAAPGPTHTQGTCPWWQETAYVPSQTLTDATTGITVTGEIPAGVTLTVNQVGAAVDDVLSMINLEDYAEVPTVLRYDITLTKDGIAWQPTTPVTVKVPDVYETVPTDPLAEVIHMTSAVAAGYEKLANVTVNADRSVTFDATGFSTYYVVAGTQSDSSGNDTFYILRGTSVELTNVSNGNYIVTYPSGATADTSGVIITYANNEVTFFATSSAVIGEYSVTISSSRVATIYVTTIDKLANEITLSNRKDVYLTVLQNSEVVPSEPTSGGDFDWYYIHKSGSAYSFNLNQWGTAGRYAQNDLSLLNLENISKSANLVHNTEGKNVIGVIDSGWGQATIPCINMTENDWHNLLVQLVSSNNRTIYVSQGAGETVRVTSDNVNETLEDGSYRYKMYPYVVKLLINDSSWAPQHGWHIDCAVVDTLTYSVSYEFNLPATVTIMENGSLIKPDAAFYTPGTPNIPVGDMKLGSTSLSSGNRTIEIYDQLSQSTYHYKFMGWSTTANGQVEYHPNDSLPPLNGNVKLFAIWEYEVTTGMVKLTKEEKFEDPNDERKDDLTSYEFSISFTNSPDDETYPYAINAADGTTVTTGVLTDENNKVSLRHGDTLTVHNVPNGTVTITEVVAESAEYTTTWAGTTSANSNVATADVEAGVQTVVTCTNTYAPLTGNLTITKVVEGPDALKSDQFTFTVDLNDPNFNDKLGDVTFTSGVGTFTITGAGSVTIPGIKIGTTYTVAETGAPKYYGPSYAPDATGIIAAEGNQVTVTNTYQTGNLTITKTVTPAVTDAKAPVDDEFTIQVSLTLPATTGAALSYPTTYTVTGESTTRDISFTNGPATITLKAGQEATFTGLPAGTTYTVQETEAPSYYTKPEKGSSGEIKPGQSERVTINNTYNTGNLTITKVVEGVDNDDIPTDEVFSFTVTDSATNTVVKTVALKAGGSHTFNDLPIGAYTVTEGSTNGVPYQIADYTFQGVKINDEAISQNVFSTTANVETGKTASVAFTNVYEKNTTSLTVQKQVVGEGAPADEFTIKVTFTAKAGSSYALPTKYTLNEASKEYTFANGVAEVVVKAGDRITFPEVVIDTQYNVEEISCPSYYTVTYDATQTGTLTSAPVTTTITNTYNSGSLTVTKTVQPVNTNTGDKFTIDVTLNLPTGNEAKVDFAHIQQSIIKPDGVGMTLTNGGFRFTNVVDGTQIVFNNLPHGTGYTVAEVTPPEYFEVKYNGAVSDSVVGTIDAKTVDSSTKDVTVAITNTYLTGSLVITKEVEGAGMPADDSFTIEVAFTLPEGKATIPAVNGVESTTENGVTKFTFTGVQKGDAITIPSIPYNTTYTVIETGMPAYYSDTVDYRYSDNAKKIDSNTTDEVTVTNTYLTGKLNVTKEVVGVTAPRDENGKGTDEFSFTLQLKDKDDPTKLIDATISCDRVINRTGSGTYTFILKDGETAQFTQLPANVMYTVTETEHSDYTTTKTGDTGTVSTTNEAEATFTNTYKVGALKITKSVSGSSANTNDTFVFTVSGPGIEGALKVVLQSGGSVTIPELKIGPYTVTEDTNWSWRYKLSGTNDQSVTITENATTSVTFTNEVDNPYWLDGSDYDENTFVKTGN